MQHDMDSTEQRDAAMIAQAKAKVDAEITAEDEMDAFIARLARWIGAQPDVTELDEVGHGIYGFALAGVGDVSLGVNPTNQNG